MSIRAEFIKKIAPYAMSAQREYGIPASISIAQAILESGNGLSKLAREANNFFGIRADKFYLKKDLPTYLIDTAEYIKGVKVIDKKAPFRKYKDLEQSFLDHANFLEKKKRYSSLFDTMEPELWAKGLQKAGYSTSPNYADTLIKLINSEGLKKYDTLAEKKQGLQQLKRFTRKNKFLIAAGGVLLIAGAGYLIHSHYEKKAIK